MSIDRQGVMLYHEGQLIQMAGNQGKASAAEYTRATIDGCFNALVRIEDPEEVAAFAFAVADRVVGRVKTPTTWPLPKQPEPPAVAALPPPPSPPPSKPEPRRYGCWTIFTIGWCCGAAAMFMSGGVR